MPHVLLIDDDPILIPRQVRQTFPAPQYKVDIVGSGDEGLDFVRASAPDVILLDLRLPDGSDLAVYEALRAIDARIPVIFVTVAKTADTAIEAMKQGAFDYLYKPLDLHVLQRVVTEALAVAARMRSPVALSEEAEPTESATAGDVSGNFFGSDPKMLDIYKAIGRVAAQDVTVLITGESGTGKELVARALYQHSARAKEPFFALNCAAIPENLLESELFGHEKGAFTGADRRRIGKFEQYNNGTILLDEIGDMPMSLQAKILRLLQEQTFERVGGSETIRIDVRLIASTHRDLKGRCAEEKFRADLYYRLSGFTIHLPPLRDRGDDLAMLVKYFVARFSRELHRDVAEVSPEALMMLRAYAWPGNVRELQSVIKQALLQTSGAVVFPSLLGDLGGPSEVADRRAMGRGFDLDGFICARLGPGTVDLHEETHRQVDRLLLTRAIDYTKGNQREAARILGISRQTMRLKLRALGLSINHTISDDE